LTGLLCFHNNPASVARSKSAASLSLAVISSGVLKLLIDGMCVNRGLSFRSQFEGQVPLSKGNDIISHSEAKRGISSFAQEEVSPRSADAELRRNDRASLAVRRDRQVIFFFYKTAFGISLRIRNEKQKAMFSEPGVVGSKWIL
jgi:hypothetical protein